MTFENKGAMASTCVVAAQDSLNIAAANYVCTAGINDDVTIQEALNNYGEVVLLEGNYTPQANLTIPDDTCLRGQGFGTIITPTGAAIGGALNGAIEMGSRSMLKSLKVILAAGAGGAGTRPNNIKATGNSTLIENVYVVGDTSVAIDGSESRQDGIYLSGDSHKVISCHLTSFRNYGVYSTNGNYNTYSGNSVQGSTAVGIWQRGGSYNNIIGNNIDITGVHAIGTRSADNNVISGNFLHSTGNIALYIFNSSDYNTISGNTIVSSLTGISVSIGIPIGNTITGNTVVGCTSGIKISGALRTTITGNTVADNDQHGIYLESSSENVITGNQVDDNGVGGTYHGIYIYRSSYCTITGNVCNNNLIDGINVTGDATTNSDYNAVNGNVCYGNGDDGIELAGGADCNKNVVTGNQLLGNTGTPLVDGGNNTNVGHNITV